MSIDGHGVGTHAELVDVRGAAGPVRVIIQAGGVGPERITLDMRVLDLVADLRAEVAAWWESIRYFFARVIISFSLFKQYFHYSRPLQEGAKAIAEGSLRLLTQGQELSPDMDEKSLAELGIKDMQLVLVSQGITKQLGQHFRGASQHESPPPFPGRDRMPMNLLLLPENFDQLFSLMQTLSSLRVEGASAAGGEKPPSVPLPKAQMLSRRVWDILMLLPTNPHIKRRLQDISHVTEEELKELLSPSSPQKLMYTFYIVDWLGRPARLRRHSGVPKEVVLNVPQQLNQGLPQDDQLQQQISQSWMHQFNAAGGLKNLFEIFVSGQLQNDKDKAGVWCEWKQDCLSALLKLLVQFGVDPQDDEALAEQLIEASSSEGPVAGGSGSKKRGKRFHHRHTSGGGDHHLLRPPPLGTQFRDGRLLVPRLSAAMLEMMDADRVVPRLTSVLMDASHTRGAAGTAAAAAGGLLDHQVAAHYYRTGVFGRAQVVRFAMSLLVAWLFSAEEAAEDALFASNGLPAGLKALLLDDPDPALRWEVCTGLYKMCMGATMAGRSGASCTAPLLSVLLEFLDDALRMPQSRRDQAHSHLPPHAAVAIAAEEGKEPFGPACRDYFFILCRLVDNLHGLPGQPEVDSSGLIDLDQLSRQVACGLVARKNFEKRHGDPSPDDSLVGALNLLGCVMKHQPTFKVSPEGQDFLLHLLDCLFALPSPRAKDAPKCKSTISRTSSYDLLIEMAKGSLGNYLVLHGKLLDQHRPGSHLPYQWEYWPREDGRAECGFVGLTNLGSTCYMATCMQQLFMIPEARSAVLRADPLAAEGRHASTLKELQKMFAYLRDSERKAYNPLSFCKTYQMDHQSLNNGEQRDMTEFFIDLLSKMEEMTPDLKRTVKTLFGGVQTNSVVSLDCNHVSRTLEDFFTVRCQLSDRRTRNLHQSLQEVTVKDTLEGDNMYTCSQCNKKVRAEKRACFKKLPKILSLNIMRYMYNMLNMQKVEKVNTHFSFPFQLDMSPYMERNLIPKDKEDVDKEKVGKEGQPGQEEEEDPNVSYEYELIGVTVHTGTAEGGHYYAFIRDRTGRRGGDRWYSFNDAEVKPFDPAQIAAECFGGEVNSRAYDQVTEKYMDMNIEKTNSAYMLFYERVDRPAEAGPSRAASSSAEAAEAIARGEVELSEELEEWIWQDNVNFIQDNNVFDHTYFNFMWQMVGHIPTTLIGAGPSSRQQDHGGDITLLSAKLATSFFLESFIHAKEKLNIVQWVELLTKQFDSSTAACGWFLDHMAGDTNWPTTIFLRCQVGTIRQMFHRLCIHVIQKLR